MEEPLIIRMADATDAAALLKIYTPYVRDTAITFEYEPPSVAEFAGRITRTLEKYPYLVAQREGRLVGYAYASSFKQRAAYDWAVENTLYLARDCRGQGIGRQLYLALEDILRQQNILTLTACISYTETPDPHLNNASAHFHQRLGYTQSAHFKNCGYKFGRWYDVIWTQKAIGDYTTPPKPVIPLPRLRG